MTFKEELGFEITKVFFNDYNEELKEEEKAFSKEFLKVEDREELNRIWKSTGQLYWKIESGIF